MTTTTRSKAADADRMLVLCPLAFESRVLRSALRDCACEVQCCGPGAAGVHAWEEANANDVGPRGVVLAGVAGSLRNDLRVGEARIISQVRSANGAVLARPTIVAGTGASVVQVDTVVGDRAPRLSLARSSGADLVDLESAEFAMLAQSRGWRWGIVRGVSDDGTAPLPAEARDWIDGRGRTVYWAVIRALARRPGLWRDLTRTRRNALAALEACGRQVRLLANSISRDRVET